MEAGGHQIGNERWLGGVGGRLEGQGHFEFRDAVQQDGLEVGQCSGVLRRVGILLQFLEGHSERCEKFLRCLEAHFGGTLFCVGCGEKVKIES